LPVPLVRAAEVRARPSRGQGRRLLLFASALALSPTQKAGIAPRFSACPDRLPGAPVSARIPRQAVRIGASAAGERVCIAPPGAESSLPWSFTNSQIVAIWMAISGR